MWNGKKSLAVILGTGLSLSQARADERHFTYSYEPEALPQHAMEFEQWVTLRAQRSNASGQDNYHLWEIRSALEYGVTDNYSVELYINSQSESFRDPGTGVNNSKFSFEGISVENRLMILNPADQAIGLSLYLEPRFSGEEAEVEEKLILGQRHGQWKWAFNLTHSTVWINNLRETEGEVEGSLGISRNLNARWSIGLELRDHNELPGYAKWENTALFLGPVLSYRQEKWWSAFTVMPQIYGASFDSTASHNSNLELISHEKVDVRLIFGISF